MDCARDTEGELLELKTRTWAATNDSVVSQAAFRISGGELPSGSLANLTDDACLDIAARDKAAALAGLGESDIDRAPGTTLGSGVGGLECDTR